MKVAFLGLGRMGEPMAQNLAKAGLLAAVWNRSDGRTGWCGEASVRVASSPADAAAGADVVIMMLADDRVALTVGAEALAAMDAGSVLVDMGTSGPDAEHALARAAAERGVGFVDAPVSGSIALARAGTLTTLVGGSAQHLEQVRPALAAMTRAQHHLGEVGSGAVMKLALNTMIAVTNESIGELLVLCERAGLGRPAAYAALADSALASPFVQYKQAAYLAPDDEPVGFTPRLMLKDLALASALAGELGVDLPAVEAARGVLERTVAAGMGDGDLVRVADTLRSYAP
ncbi:MAG: 3-hydroxyisobutyrate dehydrogenase [Gaiellales bacterium]|jgi:3-hydroxyisobutyrate dehydrogenase/2-hydroxy-3-oxopropionate reductase|nr:3-hydroxyisobutyrate dehydrogenase [Gaiellales bacterium]